MDASTINEAVTMTGEATRPLLMDRYRVLRQLGQGGMGSVWLAEDTQLDDKPFAIKMLPNFLVFNKRAYKQLKEEALRSMKLSHPNVVTLRAFEENHGNSFLVMDYIEGVTLDDLLAEKGVLAEDEAVRILKPVAAALDYAHGEGVIHRDIKPSNVMIRKDGRPFVMDFGIAREIQETMTRVSGKSSSGTLMYMSPEQLDGAKPGVEQDIYSFAVMAYECLNGEPPFCRGAIEDQIRNRPPKPLPASIGIANAVMRALAKRPENRPKSCAEALVRTAPMEAKRTERRDTVESRAANDDSAKRIVPPACAQENEANGGGLKMKRSTVIYVGLLALLGFVFAGIKYEQGRNKAQKIVRTSATPSVPQPVKPVATPDPQPMADDEPLRPQSPQDGECRTFTLPGNVEMEMVYVAPGSFRMGSEDGDDDEKPVHEVDIRKGYWIGRNPMTQAQWNALVEANNVRFGSESRPVAWFSATGGGRTKVSGMDTSQFPMENISWNDCDAMVRALNSNESSSRRWMMPTEAQWEFAARGGNKSKGYRHSGSDNMNDVGWYYENSGEERLDDSNWQFGKLDSNKCRTHSVYEKYCGNELGIVGMSGNVFEWCRDWYGKDYYANSPSADPIGPASGDYRVLRGGSWLILAGFCRSASRISRVSGYRDSIFGFRLACSAGPRE